MTGNHNVLHTAGPLAARIAAEFWVYLAVLTAVWVVVLAAFIYAFIRGRRRSDALVDPLTQTSLRRHVGSAIGISAVILFALTISSFVIGRSNESYSAHPKKTLTIRVIGHQWWWEFLYENARVERSLGTNNELHIPINTPILIKGESRDVIHSFWIPALQGKRDLMPGYTTTMWLRADKPGIYEGQCAEYCGHQHAKMRLVVVAHPVDEFWDWYAKAERPAVEPADSLARRGRAVFMTGPCVTCHSIRGTEAGARLGPDLTHIASQRMLAANSVPNSRGFLAAWIADPQSIKPGVRMPPTSLHPQDLNALIAYLETLK